MSALTKLRMMLFPAATDTPVGSVMVMVVPVLLPVAVPMFLTKAMPARASEAPRPSRSASASVAPARRIGPAGEWAVIAAEVGGRRVIRIIVSPLRMAKADQQLAGRSPPRWIGEVIRAP